MKFLTDQDCPQDCNLIKFSVREKSESIEPNLFCTFPKSLYITSNNNIINSLPGKVYAHTGVINLQLVNTCAFVAASMQCE
jgi:hypothetical protein